MSGRQPKYPNNNQHVAGPKLLESLLTLTVYQLVMKGTHLTAANRHARCSTALYPDFQQIPRTQSIDKYLKKC